MTITRFYLYFHSGFLFLTNWFVFNFDIMMDEYKDKRYIKEIIKEYNILLESWGSSESWDLNQFKTLEI